MCPIHLVIDNAMIESFWGRMQAELLDRKTWTTVVELSLAMADYIENFRNTTRRHSSLAMLTSIEYERINATQTATIVSPVHKQGSYYVDPLQGAVPSPYPVFGGASLKGLLNVLRRSDSNATS